VNLAAGTPSEALALHTQALAIATEIEAPPAQARALEGIGQCQLRLGNTAAGATSLRQALQVYRRIGSANAARVRETLRAHGLPDGSAR